MPWNHPLMNMRVANRVMDPVIPGTEAMNRFITADRASPSGMK